VSELLYKQEVFQLVGLCMEIHRELGKGHDEVIYKDALVVELTRAGIPFSREKNYEITYKGVIASLLLRGLRYLGENSVGGESRRKTDRLARQTSAELSGGFETTGRSVRQRYSGMEKSHFIDTNCTSWR
jgi:PD-(D/E)XK nuclease superfamily